MSKQNDMSHEYENENQVLLDNIWLRVSILALSAILVALMTFAIANVIMGLIWTDATTAADRLLRALPAALAAVAASIGVTAGVSYIMRRQRERLRLSLRQQKQQTEHDKLSKGDAAVPVVPTVAQAVDVSPKEDWIQKLELNSDRAGSIKQALSELMATSVDVALQNDQKYCEMMVVREREALMKGIQQNGQDNKDGESAAEVKIITGTTRN